MDATGYDAALHSLIAGAYPLSPSDGDPCSDGFPAESLPLTLVLYIDMHDVRFPSEGYSGVLFVFVLFFNLGARLFFQTHDFETWLVLAKCWKIWDLDVRGFHKR